MKVFWAVKRWLEDKRRLKAMLEPVTPKDATWLVLVIAALALLVVWIAALYFGTIT